MQHKAAISAAGNDASIPQQSQDKPSGTFSARALRRSGWQQPPTHRAGTQLPVDTMSASSHSREDGQASPRRSRAERNETHEQNAWGDMSSSPSSFTRSITGSEMHMHGSATAGAMHRRAHASDMDGAFS